MTAGPTTATASGRRFDPYNAAVPLVLFVVLIVAIGAASLLMPSGMGGTAALAIGVALLAIAYWFLPKPTLLAFALFILFYDTFARWFGPSLRNLDEAALPVLLLLGLWRTKPWQERAWFEPVRDGALVALVALAVIASLVQGVPPRVWILGLLLMLKGIVFLYVVLWHHFDDRDVRQMTVAVFGVGLVVVGLAAAEFANASAFRSLFSLPGVADARGQLPGLQSIFS